MTVPDWKTSFGARPIRWASYWVLLKEKHYIFQNHLKKDIYLISPLSFVILSHTFSKDLMIDHNRYFFSSQKPDNFFVSFQSGLPFLFVFILIAAVYNLSLYTWVWKAHCCWERLSYLPDFDLFEISHCYVQYVRIPWVVNAFRTSWTTIVLSEIADQWSFISD